MKCFIALKYWRRFHDEAVWNNSQNSFQPLPILFLKKKNNFMAPFYVFMDGF